MNEEDFIKELQRIEQSIKFKIMDLVNASEMIKEILLEVKELRKEVDDLKNKVGER